MKFKAAYYLLLLYITVIAKPLVPVISNVISHTLGEALHMATVHARYGNNHVEAEVATSQSKQNSKDQSTLTTQEQVPVHLFVEQNIKSIYTGNISCDYSLLRISMLLAIHIPKHIPPPKFS